MKRILLVTHHFPPDSAVGAVRVAKFAKYLPQFGWEPVVLTVKASYYDATDVSGEDIGCTVFRCSYMRNPSYYYRKLKRLLLRYAPPVSASMSSATSSNKGRPTLKDWINALAAFPDEDTGWIPFGILKGRSIVHRYGISCVLTSGPPHSTHLLGAWLAKSAGIPWVADFRDPYSMVDRKNPAYNNLGRKLEAHFVDRAAVVLSTTQRLTDEFIRRYPTHGHKFVTLTNGYDPDDFSTISRNKASKFTISYLGTLYIGRDPEPVLRAVASLIEQGEIDRGRVALKFIGDCAYAAGKPMEALTDKYGLSGSVEVLPWLSKQEAFEIMTESHVLLLLAEKQELMIPAKVYEYLGVGTEVLALTGDGATADLLRQVGQSAVHEPSDLDAIEQSIRGSYHRYLENPHGDHASLNTQSSRLSRYDRRALTDELAKLLDNAVAEHESK